MHPVPWWHVGPAPYAVGPFAVEDSENPGSPRVGACLVVELDDTAETGRTAVYTDDKWTYPYPDPLMVVKGDTIRLSDTVYLRPYRAEDSALYEARAEEWDVPGWAGALATMAGMCKYEERDAWLDMVRSGGDMGTPDGPEEYPCGWVSPRR